jgi:NAD(P)-dependent dehydrogenase (short-subunit alcohol dehydrogenase family)
MSIPSFSLSGKVAVITGGKRGIGKAIALAFAEAGADVVVCGRVVEDGKLEAVSDEIRGIGRRSLAVQADVSHKADVDNLMQKVVAEFGTIDILVNNAAVLILKPLLEMPEDEWDKIIDIDLKGYYLCSQAAGKVMVKQKKGTIINMASLAAMVARERTGAYCCAKAGVVMLTKVLALELAKSNVRVNAIAPFMLRTEMYDFPAWSDLEFVKQREGLVPLGGLIKAEPSDAVGAALFLASDDAARYITGHTILLDGGASIFK